MIRRLLIAGLLVCVFSTTASAFRVTERGSLPMSSASHVDVWQENPDILFVADGSAGLKVVDVSDLSNPTIIASRQPGASTYFTLSYATTLYVLTYSEAVVTRDTFFVFDVTNPASPDLLGSLDVASSDGLLCGASPPDYGIPLVMDNAFPGRLFYGGGGIDEIDVNDPANPVIFFAQPAGPGAWPIRSLVDVSFALYAGTCSDLTPAYSFNKTKHPHIVLENTLNDNNVRDHTNDMAFGMGYLFHIGTHLTGVEVVHVLSPSLDVQGAFSSSLSDYSSADYLAYADSMLLLASSYGFYGLLDVTDALNPVRLAEDTLPEGGENTPAFLGDPELVSDATPNSYTYYAYMPAGDSLHIVQFGCCSTPGDANNDGAFMNIADVTFGIARIFSGGPPPPCADQADANGDNAFNIADVTFGIARIFSGGPAPTCGRTGE